VEEEQENVKEILDRTVQRMHRPDYGGRFLYWYLC